MSATQHMFLKILDPTKHADLKNIFSRMFANRHSITKRANRLTCGYKQEHIENAWRLEVKNEAATMVRIGGYRNTQMLE